MGQDVIYPVGTWPFLTHHDVHKVKPFTIANVLMSTLLNETKTLTYLYHVIPTS